MQFHKLEKSKDKSFWSVRVSSDIRLIVHKTDASLLICYVDHHDAAYRWAERRKLETHPKTGAAQFVEIRERIKEITIPTYVEAEKPLLFAHMSREALLKYGVPEELSPIPANCFLLTLSRFINITVVESSGFWVSGVSSGTRPRRTLDAARLKPPFNSPW